jgi:hypothetical protein
MIDRISLGATDFERRLRGLDEPGVVRVCRRRESAR